MTAVHAQAVDSSGSSALAGTGRLAVAILRRDRVRLPVWIVALFLFVVGTGSALEATYPDQASIVSYVEVTDGNAMAKIMAGPGYGFEDPNLGVVLVNEVQLFGIIGFALMGIFLVTRHTRAEEEAGRADLVRSSAVGRHAPTVATLLVVGLAMVLISALAVAGLLSMGFDSTGSLALGLSIGVGGLLFAGVTASLSQVASSGRAALGMATGVLGSAFMLRAVGDVGENAVRWLSPIGWAQSVRAFAGERWWPIVLCLVAAAAATGVAFLLANHRDLGAGMLPDRPGPPRAGRLLRSPLGLAVRLQRGAVLGWLVGIASMAAMMGSLGGDLESLVEDNEIMADFLDRFGSALLIDSFHATSLNMIALLACGFAVSATLRLRTEEAEGRVEAMLAAPVPRRRWASSHLTLAFVGSGVLMAAGGLALGIMHATISDDGSQVIRLAAASLSLVPAIWVVGALTFAVFAIVPRAWATGWVLLAIVVVIGMFLDLLRLPDALGNLSPMNHAPAVPAEAFAVAPLAALLAVAVGFTVVGAIGLRRRDVAAT